MLTRHLKYIAGQSVVEVIVAISIFVLLAGGSVVVVLGSLSSSRLGEEESYATFYAQEGLSAVESIKNRSWDNLSNGSFGLSNLSGDWEFAGSSDTKDKYERVVSIFDVERDDNGNIVSGGGTIDPNTKLITSSVNWDVTTSRNLTVTLTSYLTNWQLSFVPTPTPDTTSCSQHCVRTGYSQGTCRRNTGQCDQNGEIPESGGDSFCSPPDNTCCCLP